MPNIYEEDGKYFIKTNNGYQLYDVQIKAHTIVLTPTNIVADKLINSKEYTYKELRNKLVIKGI